MQFIEYQKIALNAGPLVMLDFFPGLSTGSLRDSAFSQAIQNLFESWVYRLRYDLMQLLTGFEITLIISIIKIKDELAKEKLIEDLRFSFLVIDSLYTMRKREKLSVNVRAMI